MTFCTMFCGILNIQDMKTKIQCCMKKTYSLTSRASGRERDWDIRSVKWMPSKPCPLRINEVHRQKLGSFCISQLARPRDALGKLTARPCAPKLTEAGSSLLFLVVPVVPPRGHNAPVHERESKHHASARLPWSAQMHIRLAHPSPRDHTPQENISSGLIRASARLGRDEPGGFAVNVAMLQKHLRVSEDEVHTALNVAIPEVLPPVVQIRRVLPTQEAALVERAPVRRSPNCDRLAGALRRRVLEGDILGDEILPFHDHSAACERPRADHLRGLVVLDTCSRVRPRQDGFVCILALHSSTATLSQTLDARTSLPSPAIPELSIPLTVTNS